MAAILRCFAQSDSFRSTSLVIFSHWHPQDFFPGVGSEGVWRTEVSQWRPGQNTDGALVAKSPEADDIFSLSSVCFFLCFFSFATMMVNKDVYFLKIMHKYFIYWDFRLHLQHKKHFTTFPGGGASAPSTLPMPAGDHVSPETWGTPRLFTVRLVKHCAAIWATAELLYCRDPCDSKPTWRMTRYTEPTQRRCVVSVFLPPPANIPTVLVYSEMCPRTTGQVDPRVGSRFW